MGRESGREHEPARLIESSQKHEIFDEERPRAIRPFPSRKTGPKPNLSVADKRIRA